MSALYLEVRLRGRAVRLNHLHNTSAHIHTSPSRDQAKGMADVSSKIGWGRSRSGGGGTTLRERAPSFRAYIRERAAVGKRVGDLERMRVGREWLHNANVFCAVTRGLVTS